MGNGRKIIEGLREAVALVRGEPVPKRDLADIAADLTEVEFGAHNARQRLLASYYREMPAPTQVIADLRRCAERLAALIGELE